MSPYTPITVALFRCNGCGMVQAVKVDPTRRDKRLERPGFDCKCGAASWTRIKEVI